jgi:membrane dipeptidase
MNRRNFLASAGASLLMARGLHAAVADEQAERAAAVHKDSTVVVIHDHRPITPDVPIMLSGGVTCKVFQVGIDVEIGARFQQSADRRGGWAARTMAELNEARREIDEAGRLLPALSAADIERAKQDGKASIMLGVEGGKLLEGDLEKLQEFHEQGLRELQLRWAVHNQLVETEELTAFGTAVVRECQRLGIIVDLTHIPQRAFDQAIELSRRPMIVSHGTARELGAGRVAAIAGTGGVVGIHFYSSYLGPNPGVTQALDAIDELANSGGVESVALGIDLFPTDGTWSDFQRAQGTTDISWAVPDLGHLPAVTQGLVARGYSNDEIRAILGGNFLRVCRKVFGG